MLKKEIILIGGGGHAKVLLDILRLTHTHKVMGYCDQNKTNLDIPYIGQDKQILNKFSPSNILLVNAIGSIDIPRERFNIYSKFKKKRYKFHSVIHPSSIISNTAQLCEGVQIMAGSIVNTGSYIGENVILNTSCSIDHDVHIKAHTHITPGCIIAGKAVIGTNCHIGIGAKIIQGIEIGDFTVVGAGAVIINNIQPHSRVTLQLWGNG